MKSADASAAELPDRRRARRLQLRRSERSRDAISRATQRERAHRGPNAPTVWAPRLARGALMRAVHRRRADQWEDAPLAGCTNRYAAASRRPTAMQPRGRAALLPCWLRRRATHRISIALSRKHGIQSVPNRNVTLFRAKYIFIPMRARASVCASTHRGMKLRDRLRSPTFVFFSDCNRLDGPVSLSALRSHLRWSCHRQRC